MWPTIFIKQWTQKDWWMLVITSSDFASFERKVILHLKEFFACVNVLVQIKIDEIYGLAIDLAFLDSNVQLAYRRNIEGLIHNMKEYIRAIIYIPNFRKIAKHLLEKVEVKVSNHEHPYIIDFRLDVQIFLMDFLGGGVVGSVFKCMFLGVMVVAKVWKMNCITVK